MPIVTWDVDSTPNRAFFPRPSKRRHSSRVQTHGAIKRSAPPPLKTASARARRAKPGAKGAAKPKRSAGCGGRITGGGGRGGVNEL